MTQKEAICLKPGDRVMILETGEWTTIRGIDGCISSIFLILDNGGTYHHTQISK